MRAHFQKSEQSDREETVPRYHLLTAAAGLAVLFAAGSAIAQTRNTLDIYTVDVEGGNATLFVAPSGQSLLIDTGNVAPEAAIRDAGRILAATQDARLTQIDHLIITHWHGDHFGGVAELAKRIPIKHFIDHGANVQPAPAAYDFIAKVYPELLTRGTDGAVLSVQYHELIPMLLNELQRQGGELRELEAQNASLAARLVRLEAAVPHSASLASR